ncbi:uncharacterized protein LOC105433760 [Pogonomyrmex barbatus]|uniref:Uncharacterized protein LOC105433760 n=1 Tax=Pogonomyrmex barbatus TaxID=144034 RepID=A0A8N1SC23_9HYME|nr:uncharacterized protein LOC105433760 [Pogonomyrmex barbatus]
MQSSAVQDESFERSIDIIIKSIENVTQMKEEISISFIVLHNDIILGESIPLIINPDFKEQIYDVNFAVKFSFRVNDLNSMDPIVSTPVLIKVTCDSQNDQSPPDSINSIEESRKKVTAVALQETSTPSGVIGFCTLDLMPILLGEKSFTEKLIVQTPRDDNAVPRQNLPLLNVTIKYDGEEIFPPQANINFLSITVESIYNPPTFFAEDADYKAGTIVYIDDEILKNVIFEDGKWTKYRDVERTKRWRSLSKLQSRAKLSKWKLSRDYAHIRNTVDAELDLQKKMFQESRIEWNFMDRSMLRNAGNKMKKHLNKYKYWPFQFMVIEKNAEKDNIREREEESAKCQVYQCYVNLSELVFPGVRSTRVATQLYTHNAAYMIEKTGLEKDIFNIEYGNDKNSNERKPEKSIQSDKEVTQSIPLISEIGEPVFVIIEVELSYPLIPCRLETDFSDTIEEMMTPKIIKPYYVYSGDLAEKQYTTCIQKLVEIITESYRDELTCFTQYLYKSNTYLNVRSTLKAKVITLLDQKFKTKYPPYIPSTASIAFIYTYLVERMHLAINKIVESRFANDDKPKTAISEKLYFYAEEAYELGHIDDARRHHQTAIADKNDSEAWIRYTIFLLKIDDVECAKQCCREAILLNRRNKFALLVYGLILAENQNYEKAEIFLRAVTDFYPRFVEGWVILHLFYTRIDYSSGIDLTLRIAEKCIKDDGRETEISSEDSLAWTMIHCPHDNIFMITATLLMKLHLCDFAGLALAREMTRIGKATHILYYMAVRHYLLQEYKDSLSYLKEAECIYGLDYSISSLMGHCHFQEGNFTEAIYYYEFANAMFNRPDDLHLTQTRMGLYYEDIGDYERALKVFLSVCRTSPTAETWLGAGIAFFELRRFTEAEAALSEANQIDNRNATVWKYLCLLNISLQRHDEFIQCYEQITQDNTFSLEKRSLKRRDGKPGSVML